MKRSVVACCVLAILGAAVVGVRHENRPSDSRREQPDGPLSVETPQGDLELEQAIRRARERQAQVDGLTDRLSPGAE